MLVVDPAVPGGVRAKLLDFGIAKMLNDTVDRPSVQTQTRTGALMGTPVYMSPETATLQRSDGIFPPVGSGGLIGD